MSQYQYLVILTQQPDGGYTATVPALPGCITEGETKEQTLNHAKDAIEGYLVAAQKRGLPILTGLQTVEEVKVVAGVLKNA